jgi:protein involved in polysaccharide export with SLBB domain
LLEVKRVLVRQAYGQGRLLDPTDLTDDALFELLREDDNVRILATEEIEKREYIRAKPTRVEMQKNNVERVTGVEPPKSQATGNGSGNELAPQSEEKQYWQQHEQPLIRNQPPDSTDIVDGFSKGGFTEPEKPLQQASPTNPPGPTVPDYRRWQNMAGLQPQNQDIYDGTPPETGSLPRIGPEGMPGLLSASLSGSAPPGQRSDLPRSDGYGMSGSGGDFPRPEGNGLLPSSYSPTAGNSEFTSWPRSGHPRQRPQGPPEEEDRPAIRHRLNPYAEVPSLYDLYTQDSHRPPQLARFGEDIFRNGTGNVEELPMDLPVGPDYVLGPGDGLSIELWGGIAQHLQRVVDREGRVALPEAGAIQVTGRSLGEVQQLVQSVLRGEFRDVHADVSLGRLRTLRVYVVGDVERPGAYDVSSLSTALNALYQAGGPTARGSLRILRQYRGPRLVGEIDVYDLLLHGVRSGLERLQAGDTILIPPLGAELTVEGMVRRPAVYELSHESNLTEALQLAGGVLSTGTLRHIEVERSWLTKAVPCSSSICRRTTIRKS